MSNTYSYKKKLKRYIKTEFHKNDNITHNFDPEVKNILKTGFKSLDKYIKKNKKLHIKYSEMKNENETFTATYKPILQHRDNQIFLENKFREQLLLYKNKGYNIPNLTTKNNVIKYSPLILKTQQDIDKFYLQDLYNMNMNKKKETKSEYAHINRLLMSKNNNSDEEDDEKEGTKAKAFLDKCDELIKNKFYYAKKKRHINQSQYITGSKKIYTEFSHH